MSLYVGYFVLRMPHSSPTAPKPVERVSASLRRALPSLRVMHRRAHHAAVTLHLLRHAPLRVKRVEPVTCEVVPRPHPVCPEVVDYCQVAIGILCAEGTAWHSSQAVPNSSNIQCGRNPYYRLAIGVTDQVVRTLRIVEDCHSQRVPFNIHFSFDSTIYVS